ncbi:tereporin-Ca1 [Nematostella vectensis]|uniref:tereporin-Ca1 n=1 Tax=Nematostella vectensis TaxID=45351 RepID=UPI0020772530|nr:tereporin-Ca1 [Nematostella vectensis]
MAAVGATIGAIASNAEKVAAVAGAISSLDNPGFTWFGLASEGGSRRNQMIIQNETDEVMELTKIYLYHGKVKIPPDPSIRAMAEDECLFHSAGSWSATGVSGIVTYKMQNDARLHILWDCPFNFDYSDNFIGLMLTNNSSQYLPTDDMFYNMYQYEGYDALGLPSPSPGTRYDLVCCGPSHGYSHEAGRDKPWGHMRPCKVEDDKYLVVATMGDRHATTSKISVIKKK